VATSAPLTHNIFSTVIGKSPHACRWRDRAAAPCRHLLVVITQFGEHIHRRNKIRIVVHNALQAADVADRVQGRAADLANALGDRIGRGEDLVALLIQLSGEIASTFSQ